MKHTRYTFVLFSVASMLLFSTTQNFISAQARLVIGSSSPVFMRISGGAYFVVGDDAVANAASNTIAMNPVCSPCQSWIISEGPNTVANNIRWAIGTATGLYTVPFGYSNISSTSYYAPVTLTIGTAGAGAAGSRRIDFSTYRTTNCTNSSSLPTIGVNPPTNYTSSNIPGDASIYGIDRFWSIDASSYTTRPTLDALTFRFVDVGGDSEESGITCANTGLVAEDGTLQAQRWNSTTNAWQGSTWIKGTATPANNDVTLSSVGVVAAADFFRWWTLVSSSTPLPVEWLDFSAECNHGDVTIKWSTASEQNADFFTVERSLDGTIFSAVATKPAAGNSSVVNNYSAVDADPYAGTSFYRVRQTDFNGDFSFSNMITVTGCSSDDVFVYSMDGGAVININALKDGQYNIEIYDVLGQKMIGQVSNVAAGSNHIKLKPGNIASAVYVVKVYNNTNAVAQKLFIKSNHTQ